MVQLLLVIVVALYLWWCYRVSKWVDRHMDRLTHLEAPVALLVASWLALAMVGLYLWWDGRKK